jgi:23S rRNA pseudouridine1911/1915/1917 synthase
MSEEVENKEAEEQEDELFVHRTIVIDPKQTPIRIDKFLMDRLERVSRHRIQNALKDGAILVNDKEVKSNFKVKPGQEVTILLNRPPREETFAVPEKMDLNIHFEDEDLIILNKPANLVVHPGVGNRSGTLVNGLAYYLKGKDIPVLDGNDQNRAGLVHRLDKDTTGLMVIAKNSFTMTHLAKQFFNHTLRREYNALVWGGPEEPSGTIDVPIGRHPKYRKLQTTYLDDEGGKDAVTHYEVLEDMYYVSLVKCVLETGRTHQIRVHMKYLGHPVFNDAFYGGDSIRKGTIFTKYKQFVQNCFKLIPRQALHARTIGFIHPRTEKEVYFESELPDDMQTVLEKWRSYLSTRKTIQ